MQSNVVKKVLGEVEVSKDLRLLLIIGGLYAMSVALSNTFVNVFLWKQSGEFLDLALYNLMSVMFQPLAFVAAGKLTKRVDRVIVLRIGVSLLSLFYITVLIVGENASSFLLLLGALLGMGIGCYWLAFNVLTFEVTEPDTRDFFNGFLGLLTSFAGMLGPFGAGLLITKMNNFSGYFVIFGISLVLFLVAVFLTTALTKRNAKGQFHIRTVIQERKKNMNWRRVLHAHFFQGLREGTFVFVIVVWVYVVTNNELALGTYGLVTSSVQLVCYYLITRLLKPIYRKKAILFGGILLYGAIFLLVFDLNFGKLISYGVLVSIAYPALLIPYISLTFDVIGRSHQAGELRVEYIVVRECFLNAGRIMSIVIFIAAVTAFPEEKVIPLILLVVGSGHFWIYFFVRKIHLGAPDDDDEAINYANQGETEKGTGGTV
ncbi:MFS transporter [Shouchella shacheensis]|uniref:MFS transporter n=1 Tax=Shouchella shacheensis TaxID=1649580 RepID=UPI00073FC21F|nr:MFS transporter [Shouchella shacheensis]